VRKQNRKVFQISDCFVSLVSKTKPAKVVWHCVPQSSSLLNVLKGGDMVGGRCGHSDEHNT